MTTLAETYMNFEISASDEELLAFKNYLEIRAGSFFDEFYSEGQSFEVEVEHGSVKAWIKVAGYIYIAIAGYGSFRSGIDHLVSDAKKFSDYVSKTVIEETQIPKQKVFRIERRTSVPGKIKRTLDRIENLKSIESSSEIYTNEYNSVTKQLKSILTKVEDRDIELFTESLSVNYGVNIPKNHLYEPQFYDFSELPPPAPSEDNEGDIDIVINQEPVAIIREEKYLIENQARISDGTLSNIDDLLNRIKQNQV